MGLRLPQGFQSKLGIVWEKFLPAGLHAVEASYVSASALSAFVEPSLGLFWAILDYLEFAGRSGWSGPTYHIVWTRFPSMRRYLAFRPQETPRVFRMLNLIAQRAPGHVPVHLLMISAADIGFVWDGVQQGWIRAALFLGMFAGPIQHFRAPVLRHGSSKSVLSCRTGKGFPCVVQAVHIRLCPPVFVEDAFHATGNKFERFRVFWN